MFKYHCVNYEKDNMDYHDSQESLFEHWLEAAYVYYRAIGDVDPIMTDYDWDMRAKMFEKDPPLNHPKCDLFKTEDGYKFFSAGHLSEEDYPEWIRRRHGVHTQ